MRPNRELFDGEGSTYFVSTQTAQRQPFFRHERWAKLFEQALIHYGENDFCLHAFVIMPDHVHILITPKSTIEKAVQLIKGGFSFRARKEMAWKFEIWHWGSPIIASGMRKIGNTILNTFARILSRLVWFQTSAIINTWDFRTRISLRG
jgi:REP element-mobilizing transposase RayT